MIPILLYEISTDKVYAEFDYEEIKITVKVFNKFIQNVDGNSNILE